MRQLINTNQAMLSLFVRIAKAELPSGSSDSTVLCRLGTTVRKSYSPGTKVLPSFEAPGNHDLIVSRSLECSLTLGSQLLDTFSRWFISWRIVIKPA
jgi:hypothetical protein